MKLTNEFPNYSCTVVRIHNLVTLENMDNLVAFPVHGFQALVSKDHTVGELGIVFSAECQLSDDYCKNNNLYRHSEKNLDTTKTGYLEDSRRIKALKLRGNVSSCLFMSLSSLNYLGIDTNELKEGDSFTHINGQEVCRKYVIEINQDKSNKIKGQNRKNIYVDENIFKQHVETEHFLRNLRNFKDNDWIIVTEKIHSVSGRFANLQIDKKLTIKNKIAKFLGVSIQTKEFKTFCGSRRVVKIGENQGYYQNDIWNTILERIKNIIPKNTVIYSEIVGWDGNKELQKDYSYNLPEGELDNYIYRIASVNEDGFMIDWSWNQVKKFCKDNNLKHVPEIFQGFFKDFDYTIYENKKFREELNLTQCLPLCKKAPCSEGLVIRLENGYIPYLTKYKSPDFYIHEGVQISNNILDLESEESYTL